MHSSSPYRISSWLPRLLRQWYFPSWRAHGTGSGRDGGRQAWRASRAAVVLGLLLGQPVQAAEACGYSCPLVRWAAKNFTKEKIAQAIATASPGQLAACRKCLRNDKP